MSLSIERRGDLWGERPAVLDDGTVTYAELAARAERDAGRLAALGVDEGDAVAVVSRNRVESLALLFAARRLGAAFAPVSHRLTPVTVEEPIERIDPAVVLHEAAQDDLVREFDSRSFGEFGRVDPDPHDPAPPAADDSLLYLHDADGSVVDLSARAVEYNCVTAAAGWGLGRDDRTPTWLPLSNADGLLRFALPVLYAGGRVVCHRAFDPSDAVEGIERHGVTCAVGGRVEFRELVDEDAVADADFSSVDWLVARTRLPADAREAFPVPVVWAYGRPEVGVSVLRTTREKPERAGRPFPDPEVRLRTDDSAGADGVGELEVRGPTTARGYLGGETFGTAASAAADSSAGQWVSTGDLFRRTDGEFVRVGRIGESFGREGERVHPGAVEAVLESFDGVREAGVVGVDSDAGGTAPKAVVVGDVDADALRECAEERLAPHEAPHTVEVVASLPRRRSGELDRAELRRRFGPGE